MRSPVAVSRNVSVGIMILILFASLQSHGQGTIQIAFDDPPQLPGPGQSFFVQQYTEAGMWFRPLGVVGPGNGFGRQRGGGQLSGAADNGTAYIATALGESFQFSFLDGSTFNLVAVDLAEYSTVLSDPATVPFIGYRQDGSMISTDLTTDGIIDGSGPLADFQTFNFGSEWSGLTRVEIPDWGWSMDNLVVAVPEPSAVALLLVGGGLFTGMCIRRRTRSVKQDSPCTEH